MCPGCASNSKGKFSDCRRTIVHQLNYWRHHRPCVQFSCNCSQADGQHWPQPWHLFKSTIGQPETRRINSWPQRSVMPEVTSKVLTERGFLPTLRRPCQFGLAESREREGDNSACQQQPNCQHNVHTHGVYLTVSCKIVIVGKMQQRGSERARIFFCLRDLPLIIKLEGVFFV
jgi:hypothetical protein